MMPAASNKIEPKTSSEAGDMSKMFLIILDKKVRNIEKRKSKLDIIRAKKEAGTVLEREQQETLMHYDGVVSSLEFARDLQKTFLGAVADVEKQQKKQLKREKMEKAAIDLKRTADILQIQTTLESLGSDTVREHFKTGKHGAVVLTEDNLNSFDEVYKLITPPTAGETNFSEAVNTAAENTNHLVEGKDRPVAGSTFKELMDLLTLISGCGYFEKALQAETDSAPTAETECTENTEEVQEEAPREEQKSPIAPDVVSPATETFSEPSQPENRPPSPPVESPSPEIEEQSISHSQIMQSTVTTHESPAPGFAPQMPMSPSPTMYEPPPMESPPQPAAPKSRALAEIVSQVEGTFSFLQESEIDLDYVDPAVIEAKLEGHSNLEARLDGQSKITRLCVSAPHIDPAVVAAQPMMRPSPVSSQQAPQTNMMAAGFPVSPHVDQSGDSEAQDPLSLSQQSITTSNLDYSGASQNFAQAALSHSQSLSSGVVADAMFHPPVEETPTAPSQQQHTPHGMMGQVLASGEPGAPFDLPPSIPMPPSQQGQQDGAQMTGQEKKFQLNASATEFQSRSIYSQMPMNMQPPNPQNLSSQQTPPQHQPGNLPESRSIHPPPATGNADFPTAPNFAQAASEFIPAGGNFQGGFPRGGRGANPGYRGAPRGGRGGNNNANAMQNGFANRPQNGNPRPSNRGGGASFQGFPPRPDYRPDGYQGYNANGFGGAQYQKRGGAGGPGYPRGNNTRGAGGMRGVPRGAPHRPATGTRGGMTRPANQ